MTKALPASARFGDPVGSPALPGFTAALPPDLASHRIPSEQATRDGSVPPVWDFDVSKRLEHGERRFDIHVSCLSHARRLVMFGPSGAGKSQTLKMLAGLVRPDAGHIRIGGDLLYSAMRSPASTHGRRIDLSPQRRRLAFLFQDYALFPHLTVEQNVAFSLSRSWINPTRRSAAVRHPEVERWITAFDLDAVRQLHPQQLSGGQRQRTALARALVGQPRAILLDEPFAALDRALRHRLRDELAELQAQLSIPILTITHDEDDVKALADDVVVLEAGKVRSP